MNTKLLGVVLLSVGSIAMYACSSDVPPSASDAGSTSGGTGSGGQDGGGSGTASAGTASAGTASAGTASGGTASAGTASAGTASAGTASAGTTGGDASAGTTGGDASAGTTGDAGTGGSSDGGLKPFGETCAKNGDCASNACFMGGQGSYCSIVCTLKQQTDPVCTSGTGKCNNQGFCQK